MRERSRQAQAENDEKPSPERSEERYWRSAAMMDDDAGPAGGHRVDESTGRGRLGGRVSRMRILDAALGLFAARGFDGTSIKRISEAARVPPGLIYYYFGDKRGLLKALVDERTLLPELRAALEPAPSEDPALALVGIGRRLYETVKRNERMARILFCELHLSGDVAAGFREVCEAGLRLVAAHVRGEIEAGRLRPVDAEALSRLFLSNVVFAAVFEEPEDPKRFVEETVGILLAGLVPQRRNADNKPGEAG